MTLALAELLVHVLGAYAVTGTLFGVAFLWRWVGRLDPAAAHATWGFRVLVLPGVVMFWPLFAVRLLSLARRSHLSKAAARIEILR